MSEKDEHNLLAIREAIEKIVEYASHFEDADIFYDHTLNFDLR